MRCELMTPWEIPRLPRPVKGLAYSVDKWNEGIAGCAWRGARVDLAPTLREGFARVESTQFPENKSHESCHRSHGPDGQEETEHSLRYPCTGRPMRYQLAGKRNQSQRNGAGMFENKADCMEKVKKLQQNHVQDQTILPPRTAKVDAPAKKM